MNPKTLEIYNKAEQIKYEEKDKYLWMMGSYVFEAVSTALSNAFRKKGSQARQFRDRPYSMLIAEERKELTEKEKIEKTKLVFQMLQVRKANFELEKKFKKPN